MQRWLFTEHSRRPFQSGSRDLPRHLRAGGDEQYQGLVGSWALVVAFIQDATTAGGWSGVSGLIPSLYGCRVKADGHDKHRIFLVSFSFRTL